MERSYNSIALLATGIVVGECFIMVPMHHQVYAAFGVFDWLGWPI